MKTKFLALAEEVKQTGIAETLYKTSNVEELKEVWHRFLNDNHELITKIKGWADEFRKDRCEEIFACEEKLDNPMEIAITIYIIDDWDNISEFELFDDPYDLTEAIKNIGNPFTSTIANLMYEGFITDIMPEVIFLEAETN